MGKVVANPGMVDSLNSNLTLVDKSSSLTLASGYTSNNKSVYKYGKVVNLVFSITGNFTSGTVIATLADDIKPKAVAVTAMVANNNTGLSLEWDGSLIWVYGNGNIVFYGTAISSISLLISVTYITN